MAGYSARCLNVIVSITTTKLNLKVVVFCDFVDPLFWFFGSKNGAVFWPQ